MALERDAYKAFEAVVGPKYISEDPGTLTGYHYNWGIPGNRWQFARPLAVVLPESTGQVQGIVKVCNRYNIQFKAHSTGYAPVAMADQEGVVIIDLRRMNRIIDIDEKNMLAIVEPYAVAGQIQAEAMKRGLDTQIVSAGPTHSPLASCTSAWGIGTKGLTQSFNERNLFGVEWVLPSGEAVWIGSPATGGGWFSGDGPGPSLRSIIRGTTGAFGGNGVFTRIGLKLYPWPGKDKVECTGEMPQIGMKIDENMDFSLVYFENWADMTEAAYKIIDNRVGFSLLRMPPEHILLYFTRSNDEQREFLEKGTVPVNRAEHQHMWQCVVAGQTKREFDYRKKVFEQIVKEAGGKYLQLTQEQKEILYAGNVRISYVPRFFRPTGDTWTTFGMEESFNLMGKLHTAGEALFGKYVDEGIMPNHGREQFWAWTNEGRNLHSENAFAMNPEKPAEPVMQYTMESTQVTIAENLGVQILPGIMGPFADMLGPAYFNAQKWMRKTKYEVIDPDNVSEHSNYIYPEPLEGPPGPPKS